MLTVIYSFVRGYLVDLIGIEPMTSSMPWKRAPSCATGPLLEDFKHCRVALGFTSNDVWKSAGTKGDSAVSISAEWASTLPPAAQFPSCSVRP